MAICCPPEQTRADPQGGAALRGAEATRPGDGLPLAHTQPESKASGLQLQSTPQTCPSSPPHRPHPSLLPPRREAAVASSLAFLPQPCGLFPHDSRHNPTEPKFVQVPPPRTAPAGPTSLGAKTKALRAAPRPHGSALLLPLSPHTLCPSLSARPQMRGRPHRGATALAGPSAWGSLPQVSTAVVCMVSLCRKASPPSCHLCPLLLR